MVLTPCIINIMIGRFNFNIYFFLECTVNGDCNGGSIGIKMCCIGQECVECPAGCIINVMIGRFNFNPVLCFVFRLSQRLDNAR